MTTNLPPQLQYSPYFAGLDGKTPAEADTLQDRIDALPERARSFLFNPDIPEKLQAMLTQNSIEPQYRLAMAKILFLAVLGDISIASIDQLLVKLDLEPRQASMVSAGLTTLLSDVIAERGRTVIGHQISEMRPLTQRVPPVTPIPNSPPTLARNIIDLRKQ